MFCFHPNRNLKVPQLARSSCLRECLSPGNTLKNALDLHAHINLDRLTAPYHKLWRAFDGFSTTISEVFCKLEKISFSRSGQWQIDYPSIENSDQTFFFISMNLIFLWYYFYIIHLTIENGLFVCWLRLITKSIELILNCVRPFTGERQENNFCKRREEERNYWYYVLHFNVCWYKTVDCLLRELSFEKFPTMTKKNKLVTTDAIRFDSLHL